MLSVNNLTIEFEQKSGREKVVEDCSFSLKKGEILGIVGESGSGKTMTALAIEGLLPLEAKIAQGSILFEKRELLQHGPKERTRYQGKEMAMIFQEPMTSLNPLMKIGAQIEETLRIHEKKTREEYKRRALEVMTEVELPNPEKIYDQYPHQLSGGMRQRAMIAIAIICNPKLLIADEPTTALDIHIQGQILRLLKKIHREHHMSMLFISHDLRVIKEMCHRVLVMKDGRIVEEGTVDRVFDSPEQDYTKELIKAMSGRKTSRKELSAAEIKGDTGDVLEVSHINSYYEESAPRIFRKNLKKQILFDVSFSVKKGEILGLVGESGSGKTTLAKVILGMVEHKEGMVVHHTKSPQMVFQDPFSSLNPVKKIGWILEEPLKIKGVTDKGRRREEAVNMLSKVGLKGKYLSRYPSELSGGQRQRVCIALALMTGSKLILADEPVSALDVTVQSQILELLLKLREELALSYLFISHDLNVIYQVCDRVMVMKDGKILEMGDVEEVFQRPVHEYTKQLLKESFLAEEIL